MADDPDEEEVVRDKRGLPPIHRIAMPPEMQITSTKIRWLSAIGYVPREIAPYLGVRYQKVRNVLSNPPKRAAREDLPPLVVKVLAITEDNLELMDQHAMHQQLAASRNAHRIERKDTNRKRRELKRKDENDFGNEDVDDEDYERDD